MAYKIKIVHSTQALQNLKSDWRQLVKKSNIRSPFLTYEWISTWWAFYARQLSKPELAIITLQDDDALLAILPLFSHRKKLTGTSDFKIVQFMGTEFESSDYLDLIAVQDKREQYLHEILASADVLNLLKTADVVDFPNLTDAAFLLAGRKAFEQALGCKSYTYRIKTCPYVPLPDNFEAFYQGLSRNFRSNLKRTQNKFKKYGFTTHLINDEQEIDEAVRRLFELHQMRFSAKQTQTKFVFEQRGAFHQQIAKTFLRNDWLQLYQIKDQDKVVGSLYCFKFAGSMMYMQGGFDPAYQKFALGNLIILRAITDAIEMGFREFDFMRGNEAYKARWATNVRYLNTLTYPVSRKGRLYYFFQDMLYQTKQSVKSVIKKDRVNK